MSEVDLDRALRVARETAAGAAGLIMEGFRSGAEVHKKGAIDLVTDYDLRAEELIRERLGAAFPDHRIVAEEGSAEPPRRRTPGTPGKPGWGGGRRRGAEGTEGPRRRTPGTPSKNSGDLVWYVDPLDGTTNFAHGHFFFCVSIALYDGSEGLVGVVDAPALGTAWHAAKGRGAFRDDAACHVSQTGELSEALCATGFPYDKWTATEDNTRETIAVLKRTRGFRRCGSAAIDLALTADGTYDAYWEQRLQVWDMAAGALLVREAGGRLSDYAGAPGDPRVGRLVATNGRVHDALLEVLAGARAM